MLFCAPTVDECMMRTRRSPDLRRPSILNLCIFVRGTAAAAQSSPDALEYKPLYGDDYSTLGHPSRYGSTGRSKPKS